MAGQLTNSWCRVSISQLVYLQVVLLLLSFLEDDKSCYWINYKTKLKQQKHFKVSKRIRRFLFLLLCNSNHWTSQMNFNYMLFNLYIVCNIVLVNISTLKGVLSIFKMSRNWLVLAIFPIHICLSKVFTSLIPKYIILKSMVIIFEINHLYHGNKSNFNLLMHHQISSSTHIIMKLLFKLIWLFNMTSVCLI